MEKETYETYEFLSCNILNNGESPLFVLQDDGTILGVNYEVQSTEEVANVKVEQPCDVYDVSSQPYFVNVDNSQQLLSVPVSDQFPATGVNNVNSLLIQPVTNTISPVEQLETDTVSAIPESKEDNDTISKSSSSNNNFTEITLSDSQYQMLEQKGWILLECNDKIFVLNTLGLHDITTNKKLIEKLKNEVREYNNELIPLENGNNESKTIENVSKDLTTSSVAESIQEPGEVKYIVNDVTECKDEEQIELSNTENDTNNVEIQSNNEDSNNSTTDEYQLITNDMSTDNCDSIRIKTRYIFNDIPEKIFLGKTVNGKKLYAKVNKTRYNMIERGENNKLYVNYGNKEECTNNITESQFFSILHNSIRNPTQDSLEIITSIQTIMEQLLNVSHVRNSITGHRIILTKIITYRNSEGKSLVNRPLLITGVVDKLDDDSVKFTHMPKLLHDLMKDAEDPLKDKKMLTFYHIHIAESKLDDNVPKQAIHIHKRKLSLDILRDKKKKHPYPMFACGACAAVFQTEDLLKHHQENMCFEADDTLMIDTDKFIEPTDQMYKIIENGNEKLFCCTQCDAKFARRFNCKKHIKTHDIPSNSNSDSDDSKRNITKKIFKCKMCPSSYFHSSSLSKHIVKMHINV